MPLVAYWGQRSESWGSRGPSHPPSGRRKPPFPRHLIADSSLLLPTSFHPTHPLSIPSPRHHRRRRVSNTCTPTHATNSHANSQTSLPCFPSTVTWPTDRSAARHTTPLNITARHDTQHERERETERERERERERDGQTYRQGQKHTNRDRNIHTSNTTT